MGETASWAIMNVAVHCGPPRKIPVMVYSLEMGGNQLTQRLCAAVQRLTSKKVRDGFLADHSLKNLCQARTSGQPAPALR